ncbi:MAG: hypothetical protein GWN16_07590 [Calditrichae bacterium]|nr:hypothetical protein [Calditrichia bacterium]
MDYNSDYILLENGITFFESIRVKKAFYKTLYDSIEMDVQTRVINAEEEGKYGVIFGHDLDERGRYHHFYLFSINTDFEYSLERITDNQIDVLDSAPVQPSVADGNKFTHLKVKSLGQLVLLYANGDLLNMLKVDKPDTCGFGFYADPKLQVKFSDFKISPVQVK